MAACTQETVWCQWMRQIWRTPHSLMPCRLLKERQRVRWKKKKKYVMRICLNSNTTGDPSAQWDSKSSTRVKLSFNEVHLRFSFMLEVLRWIWLEGREVFEVFENVLLNFRSSKNWSCQASSWRLWRRRRNWRESSRLGKGQCWSNAGKWCARKAKRKWVFFSIAYC